jgi:hypothetical protein
MRAATACAEVFLLSRGEYKPAISGMEHLQPATDDAGRHRYNRGFPHLTPDSMDITFGPVPSRRLGRSLGINHIPPKHCSYSCRYCQVGPTHHQEIERRTFYTTEEVFRDVTLRVEALRATGRGGGFPDLRSGRRARIGYSSR